MLHGSIVALITPFKDGKIDEKTLENLVEWQITQGTHGIVPCGTTGESFLLSHAEQKRIIEICVSVASKRVPIMPGTGAIGTEETIVLTKQANQLGADAALIATPAYIKPTQPGLYAHYQAIHDQTNIPIVLYNHPARAGVGIEIDTLYQLAKLDRIIGIKDASNCLSRQPQIHLGVENFIQLTGYDPTAVAFLAQGGHGCISATANIVPKRCAALHNAWRDGDMQMVRELRDYLHPLHTSLSIETNPVPAKYASSLLGLCNDEVRKPLVTLSETSKTVVRTAMQEAGLLSNVVPITAP